MKRIENNPMSKLICIITLLLIISVIPCQMIFSNQDTRAVIRNTSSLNHQSGKPGTYRALIIGIQNYDDPKIPDLNTPINDARAVGQVLKNKYGFETTELLDEKATRKAIYTALREITNTSKLEDNILIYYAGHGDIDKTFNDGWWIPADAKGGAPDTYIENTLIQKVMKNLKSKHVLLISDSCYSGTLFGQATRAMPKVIDNKYYFSLDNEKSRWGMTSGNKTPVSDGGSEGHSVFAFQLIKKLKKNTKSYLSTREIFASIAPVIDNNSEQSPMCRPVIGTGDEGGEFIFIAQGTTPVATPGITDSSKESNKGTLGVISDPRGATIFLDNKSNGISPLVLHSLDPGTYPVTVKLKGHTPKTEIVRITKGEWVDLYVDLDKEMGPSATPSPGDIWKNPVNGMEFVFVPGGCFKMGQTKAETQYLLKKVEKWEYDRLFHDEFPRHEICVNGFWMGKYEVTNRQYRQFKSGHDSKDHNGTDLNDDDQPAVYVSWNDANAFAKWMAQKTGQRFGLPTEAQWEYAARAGTNTIRYWGDNAGDACRYANVHDDTSKNKFNFGSKHKCDDGYTGSAPVGSFAPNRFGLHDMLGNVWEWCEDVYDEDAYSKHLTKNPVIISGGSSRVFRGGAWCEPPMNVRAASRNNIFEEMPTVYTGFRLCLPLVQQ